MFIETYYDDRAAVPGSTSEPMIPYPELARVNQSSGTSRPSLASLG